MSKADPIEPLKPDGPSLLELEKGNEVVEYLNRLATMRVVFATTGDTRIDFTGEEAVLTLSVADLRTLQGGNDVAAASGTATRTTFATGSVTTEQLAERVKAMIDDLRGIGLWQ